MPKTKAKRTAQIQYFCMGGVYVFQAEVAIEAKPLMENYVVLVHGPHSVFAHGDHQRHITPEATEELKIDGFRSLAYIENGQCDLVSRNGNSTPDGIVENFTRNDQCTLTPDVIFVLNA